MTKSKRAKKVMFVCSGNTCRSPMAEYLFRDLCEKNRLNIEVTSRAVANFSDFEYCYGSYRSELYGMSELRQPMSRDAITTVKDYNSLIKGMEGHYANQLSTEDIESSDLILAMEERMRDSVIRKAVPLTPEERDRLERKVFSLKEYVEVLDNLDIIDPIGCGYVRVQPFAQSSIFVYDDCASMYGFDRQKSIEGYAKCREEILECLVKIVDHFKHPVMSRFRRIPLDEILKKRNERRVTKKKREEELALKWRSQNAKKWQHINEKPKTPQLALPPAPLNITESTTTQQEDSPLTDREVCKPEK